MKNKQKKFDANDILLMVRALKLASLGRFTTTPNPVVGAVIVNNGSIVGEGYHQKAGEPHAERLAIAQAGEKAKGATLYVTLEPCCHTGRTGPCTDAIIESGITQVWTAMQDPNPQVAGKGASLLNGLGISCDLLDGSVPEDELSGLPFSPTPTISSLAKRLNQGFIQRMTTGRPWVQLKMASSIDGRIAMANGESKWITGQASRKHVQGLRLASCGILTTSQTVLTDNARLNVRPEEYEGDIQRQPSVILLDSSLSCQPPLNLFKPTSPPRNIHIFTSEESQSKHSALSMLMDIGAKIHFVKNNENAPGLNLPSILDKLGTLGINRIFVEAGSVLAGDLLQQQLVNELTLFQAPTALGHQAKALFHLPQLHALKDKIQFSLEQVETIGSDLKLTLIPQQNS